jgi:hypothetical protein
VDKKIMNLHRRNTNNIGDLMCAPYLFFPDLLGSTAHEILGFRSADEPDRDKRVLFNETFSSSEVIVVGGGGLLEIDFFKPFFDYLKERKKAQKVVIWGAGHNSWSIGDWRQLKASYTFDASLFDLIGTRDSNTAFDWLPCVSCMSSAFDTPISLKREIGVYAHVGTLNNEKFRRKLPKNFEMIDNSSSFEDAISFIGSSELILTDSFHGAYWATLLGRRVVGFPTSSKFYDLKHAIPLCTPEDWKRYSRLSQVYSDALDECRMQNRDFAKRVAELIHN